MEIQYPRRHERFCTNEKQEILIVKAQLENWSLLMLKYKSADSISLSFNASDRTQLITSSLDLRLN